MGRVHIRRPEDLVAQVLSPWPTGYFAYDLGERKVADVES